MNEQAWNPYTVNRRKIFFIGLIIILMAIGIPITLLSIKYGKVLLFSEASKFGNPYNCVAGGTFDATGVAKIDQKLKQLQKKYGICFLIKNTPDSSWASKGHSFYKLTANDYSDLETYLDLFYTEFRKYPPQFIKKTDLRAIVFVTKQKYQKQNRSALPDYYREILYYDINPLNASEEYLRHVVHHEFYHMIEEEFNSSPYFKDPQWSKLNKTDFKYKSTGSDCYVTGLPEYRTGFFSGYAQCGLEEDKAETFAALLSRSSRKQISSRLSDDKVLNQKTQYLTTFLQEYKLPLLAPALNKGIIGCFNNKDCQSTARGDFCNKDQFCEYKTLPVNVLGNSCLSDDLCSQGMPGGYCGSENTCQTIDVDRNNNISLTDYETFVKDYLAYQQTNIVQARSDLNMDDEVTLVDYVLFNQYYSE